MEEQKSAKSKGKESKALKIPSGIEVLAKLVDDLVIAVVPYELLKEQDLNAHIMTAETFKQLTQNIKKRGTVESLPLLALTSKGIEIISGHHRCRAGRDAGLKNIPALLDVSGLSRSAIASKQLAHNAINGTDDMDMVREIANIIDNVDDLLESYIGQNVINNMVEKIDRSLAPKINFEWKEMKFVFLPHQMDDLNELINNLDAKVDFLGAASIEQFDSFIETIAKYQKLSNIKNLGASIHRLIEIANQENGKSDEITEWLPASAILGSGAIPKLKAEAIIMAMDKIKTEYGLENKVDCILKLSELALKQ